MRMLLADTSSTNDTVHLEVHRFEEGVQLTCTIELCCGCDILKGQGAGVSEACLRNAQESDDVPSKKTLVQQLELGIS